MRGIEQKKEGLKGPSYTPIYLLVYYSVTPSSNAGVSSATTTLSLL